MNNRFPIKSSAILLSLQKFLAACRERQLCMVICYSDPWGGVRMLWREENAWLGSLDIAMNKAWTSIAFSGATEKEGMTTEALSKMSQPGESLYGIQNTNDGRVVIFGGGIPIYIKDTLHGAIGVSGSVVEDDVAMAQIAVDAYIDAYSA
jgi:uncharacterized protein GlcG (DUF336 family)